MERKIVNISTAARELGVSEQALRAWHNAGVITALRTPGNHRRFDLELLRRQLNMEIKHEHTEGSGRIE